MRQIRLESSLTSVLLAFACGSVAPPMRPTQGPPGAPDETICSPIVDLEPSVITAEPERAAPALSTTGTLTLWSAAEGDTLRLKVRTARPGTYEVAIRAAPGPEGPVFSARLWQTLLTRAGEGRFVIGEAAPDRLLDIRFDSIPIGPGHHLLDLECLAPGAVQLDCLALRRIGDMSAWVGRPAGAVEDPAFLGVEFGAAQSGGVTIKRAFPDTAASRAGLQAGDVLLALAGVPTTTSEGARDAIESHRPGDGVELEFLRDGERITRQVEFGRRQEEPRGTRAAHVVGVLQVRSGQVIADIGCGSGWLSEAIAAALGSDCTVYAVEIQERHIRRLHRRPIANVVPVLSTADDVSLPEGSLDTAMLHDVASHIERRARPSFYRSLMRALKPEGHVVVFDPHGKADAMVSELRGHGFIPVNSEALAAMSPEALDQQLQAGIVFRRQ